MTDYGRVWVIWMLGLILIGVLLAGFGIYGGIAGSLLFWVGGSAIFGRVWVSGMLGLVAILWLFFLLGSLFGLLGLYAGIAAFMLTAVMVRAMSRRGASEAD
jgi:hypothetical protein